MKSLLLYKVKLVHFLIMPTPSKVIRKSKDTDIDTVCGGEQSGASCTRLGVLYLSGGLKQCHGAHEADMPRM